jgi:hypothetical protein
VKPVFAAKPSQGRRLSRDYVAKAPLISGVLKEKDKKTRDLGSFWPLDHRVGIGAPLR